MPDPLLRQIDETADFLKREFPILPRFAVIAGSGLSAYAASLHEAHSLP